MKTTRYLAIAAMLAGLTPLSTHAQVPQPIKMTIGQIQMTHAEDGYYNAVVWISLDPAGFAPGEPVYAPWMQIQVNHVRTPEEATAHLYEPMSKYLMNVQRAAESLPH